MSSRWNAKWLRRLVVAGALAGGLLLGALGLAAGAVAAQGEDGLQAVREVMDLILREYRGQVSAAELIRGAVRGMLDALHDPYSYYLDPQELQRFQEDMRGSFGGIGVSIEAREGSITVVGVLPGTPADEAGLQPGDRIVAVDGQSVEGAAVETVQSLIRGRPGTEVRLRVERAGRSLLFTLKRATIDIPSVDAQLLPGQIAYIKVTQFGVGTADKFRYVYDRLVQVGAKGVIVDLRNNPGGLLDEGVGVAEVLVPGGTLVQVVDRNGRRTTVSGAPHAPGPPLVVLVNGGTASAAEIVAGAVQDDKAGTLVGTKTFGKGSVQTIFDLPTQGAVRLTTARYLTPAGRSLDGNGLVPDVVVEEADPSYQAPRFADAGTRLLRRGMIGLDVLGLQQRLNFLGYAAGPEDGILGPRTEAAARAFQRAAGVAEAPGVVAGEATFAALDQAVRQKVAGRRSSDGDLPLQRAIEILRQRAAGAAAPAGAAGR